MNGSSIVIIYHRGGAKNSCGLVGIRYNGGMSKTTIDELARMSQEQFTSIHKEMNEEVIVTVIATGFEREEAVEEERPKAEATASVSRPVHRPPALRKIANSSGFYESEGTGDEWDVPTFLRRQAD